MKTAKRNIVLDTAPRRSDSDPGAADALAAGTAAGTSVINNVTVSFSVSGQAQPDKTTSTTFKVDDKVSFTLTASDSSNVTILPGGRAYQTYVLTNTGNGPHDFTLSAVAIGGNTLTPAAGPTFYSDAAGTILLPTDANAGGLPYVWQPGARMVQRPFICI